MPPSIVRSDHAGLRSQAVKVLRSWPVRFAVISGAFLVAVATQYPSTWWSLLLWMIPFGMAVGEARYALEKERQDELGGGSSR